MGHLLIEHRFLLLSAYLLSVSAFARTEPPRSASSEVSREMLAVFVQVDQEATQQATKQQLETLNIFVEELRSKRKRYRSEMRFLSFFFRKVHRKFLKRYQGHTTVYELLERGRYDCVTGTALYALLLDALDIPYHIHEFPYHVYLTLITSRGDTVMIESTDPQYGFVADPGEQAKRAKHYSQVATGKPAEAVSTGAVSTGAVSTGAASAEEYQYDFAIRERIGLTKLAGLSYFNEAVDHYNQREFRMANDLLRRASVLYDSPRMKALARLMNGLAHN